MQDNVAEMSLELSELADKISKLEYFITGDAFGVLSLHDRSLICDQIYHMRQYHCILLRRFDIATE